MAYTNTHELRKFRDVMRDTGISRPLLLGHLTLYWQHNHTYTSEMRGVSLLPGEVERIMEWEGQPGKLEAALIQYHWIEKGKDGFLYPHDYQDFAPRSVRERLREQSKRRTETVRKPYGNRTETVTSADGSRHPEIEIEREIEHNTEGARAGNTAIEKAERAVPGLAEFEAEFKTAWNAAAKVYGLPRMTDWTPARRNLARWAWNKDFFRDNWQQALAGVSRLPDYRGHGRSGWKMDCEFFLKDGAVMKIMERLETTDTDPGAANIRPEDKGEGFRI